MNRLRLAYNEMMNKVLLFFLLVSPVAHSNSKPGFDCSKSMNCQEKLICQTPSLALLDNSLNEIYKKTTTSFKSERLNDLKLSQKEWLSERKNIPCTEDDLAYFYKARISALETLSKKDPTDYDICKLFIENRTKFKLLASHTKLDQATRFSFNNQEYSFGGEHLGTCPRVPGSFIDKDKKTQEIFEADGEHVATFGIKPWIFETSGKLIVGIFDFNSKEDGLKSDRFYSLSEVDGKYARQICVFQRHPGKWSVSGKDTKPCEFLSQKKTYDIEKEEVDLRNDKTKQKIKLYSDDSRISAGCGSEIGTEYLHIESDKKLSESLKDLTMQEYWRIKNFSFVNIQSKNFILSEPAKRYYDPRFDFPDKVLYEVNKDGTISEVCKAVTKSSIRIVE